MSGLKNETFIGGRALDLDRFTVENSRKLLGYLNGARDPTK